MKVIGESGVSCPSKDIEVTVEGNHGVSVASGGRRRSTAQDVLCGNACPAVEEVRSKLELFVSFLHFLLIVVGRKQ